MLVTVSDGVAENIATNRRPLPITILAVVYLAVGVLGFVHHFPDLHQKWVWQYDDLWIELTEIAAVVCGVFLLRGANWARWLAVAWIVLHVVLSVFDAGHGLLIHSLLALAIAWLLFRPEAKRYFR
jgi:hypothetical protein